MIDQHGGKKAARASHTYTSACDELSGACCFSFSGTFRGLKGSPIATRDRSDSAADFLIRFVRQIGQGHPQRPVRRLEASAVQQYDPVILG
jgi:hypothetical protein